MPPADSSQGKEDEEIQRVPRQEEPDLSTILPFLDARKPKDYRDNTMIKTLGLEHDKLHWEAMKSAGLTFCQDELPPGRLSDDVLQTMNLNKEQARALEYNGSVLTIKNWMWQYGLREWKTKFEYDIRYLNRRFPKGNISDIICGLISQFNSDPRMKNLQRKYSQGRNIGDAYNRIVTGQDPRPVHTIHGLIKNEQQDDDFDNAAGPKARGDDLVDAFSSISVENKPGVAVQQVDWSNVMISFTLNDNGRYERFEDYPFNYICGGKACQPFNIDVRMIRDEIRALYDVDCEKCLLRLPHTQKTFPWTKKAFCELATHWCRVRDSSNFDLALELIAHSTDDGKQPNREIRNEHPARRGDEDSFMLDTSLSSGAVPHQDTFYSGALQYTPDFNDTNSNTVRTALLPHQDRSYNVRPPIDSPATEATTRFASTSNSASPAKRQRDESPTLTSTQLSASATKKVKRWGNNDEDQVLSDAGAGHEKRDQADIGQLPDPTTQPVHDGQSLENESQQIHEAATILDSTQADKVAELAPELQAQSFDVDEPKPLEQGITGTQVLDAENLKFEQNTSDADTALLDRITVEFPEGTVTLDRYKDPDADSVRIMKAVRERSYQANDGDFDKFCSFLQGENAPPDQNPSHAHWNRERLEEIAFHCGSDDLVDFIRHPKWAVPQIPGLFKRDCTPYWYQVVEAWQLILTTEETSGAFEGSMMGLGKTWTATAMIAINLVLRAIREHWMSGQRESGTDLDTLREHHVCDGNTLEACPTMTHHRGKGDRHLAGWKWYRCPCEYVGSPYEPPRPGFGATLFLAQANSIGDVLKHFKKVFRHQKDEPIVQIKQKGMWKDDYQLPSLAIRDEHGIPPRKWVHVDRETVLKTPKYYNSNSKSQTQKPLEAPFEANGLVIITSPETWHKRRKDWAGLILGLVIMDEAHKIRTKGTAPMLVHSPAACWYNKYDMAHSKYIAMTGSVVDQNTAEVYGDYIAMFQEMGEREGHDWSNDEDLQAFRAQEIKDMAKLYNRCQEDATKKKKVTIQEKRKAAKDYDALVRRFVHRVDLNTRMFGCPVAVDNGATGIYVVKYSEQDQKNADRHYLKATEEIHAATLKKLQKRNRDKGGNVTEQELKAALVEGACNHKNAALASWFPDIALVGSEYYRSSKQHYIDHPDDEIEIVDGNTTATIPWSSASPQQQNQALKTDWKVDTIKKKGWWKAESLKSPHNPFYGRKQHMLKTWVKTCPLLTYLRWTVLEWAFQNAKKRHINTPQFLITCMDPAMAVVVDQWLKHFVMNPKNKHWYIGDDRDMTSVLWLADNLNDRKGAMLAFQDGAPSVMVSSPSVIACGHDLANVSYHIIIGEDSDISRFLQLLKRNVRLASDKPPGMVFRISTDVARERNVRDARARKLDYKLRVVREQRELLGRGGKEEDIDSDSAEDEIP